MRLNNLGAQVLKPRLISALLSTGVFLSLSSCGLQSESRVLRISGCSADQQSQQQLELDALLKLGWKITSTTSQSESCGYTEWTQAGSCSNVGVGYGTCSSDKNYREDHYVTSSVYTLEKKKGLLELFSSGADPD